MKEIQNVKDLLGIVKSFSSTIVGDKMDSMQLDCMNYLGKYTTTIQVNNAFSRMYRSKSSSMRLPSEQVYNARVISLKPLPQKIDGAVRREDNALVVDLSAATKFELIRIEIEYRMSREWLNGLVRSRSSPEPLGESMKYHLSAQLTDPQSLIAGFSEVEIEEYPVTAQVFIQEQLDTAYPVLSSVRRLKEIENKILSNTDPHGAMEIIGLQKERHKLTTRIKREAPDRLLTEVMSILKPIHFSKYIMVKPDFRLHGCEWSGMDTMLNLAGFSLPKSIDIIARTDLNLKKQAAHGEVLYSIEKFQDDVSQAVKK